MQSAQWITAARMLRRSGFGTTGAAVDAVVADGDLKLTVQSVLDTPFADDPGARSTPMPEFESALPWKGLPETERKKVQKKLQQRRNELTRWWLRRMLSVEQPVLEKLTFLWHNHFATSASVVRSARLMAAQNATIRELCLGDFRTLSYAMLTDGAMLRWLNGNSNTAKSPNENLSREFVELFALGHGNGYSEVDVREGARALTGWMVDSEESVRFEPDRHDAKSKTFFGIQGNIGAAKFCDIVLAQPSSDRFLVGRLWQQLAADNLPGSEAMSRLVDAYGPERDLKALTLAILSDPEFLEGRATLIASPVDWFIGLQRTLQVSLEDPSRSWEAAMTLKSLGQLPFYPPNVGGWPTGQAWLSTATVTLRIRAASMAVRRGDISPVIDAAASDRIDAVGYLLGIGSWTDRTAKALSAYRRDPNALVVAAAITPEYLTT